MEPSTIHGFVNSLPEVKLVCTGSQFRCENKPIHRLNDLPTELITYMSQLLVEELIIITLDTSLRPINYCVIGRGTQRSCQFSKTEIVRHCLLTGQCANVIALHNHTSIRDVEGADKPYPSNADRRSCVAINDMLDAVGVTLIDFGIIGPNNTLFSFAHEQIEPFVNENTLSKVSE